MIPRDDRHCVFDKVTLICVKCDRKSPTTADALRNCTKGTKPDLKINKYRSRTDEEYRDVTWICNECPHQMKPGMDGYVFGMEGICSLLVKQGCGSCKNMSTFVKFKQSGKACPDKPPRFTATETLREMATARTWPATLPRE